MLYFCKYLSISYAGRAGPSPFLALAVLVVGCGVPRWNPPPAPPEALAPPPASPAAVTAVAITRSACLGSCPHYHIVLQANGTATYVGVANVPRIGTYESHFEPARFRDLAAALVRNGFFTHPTTLGLGIDGPVTSIRVTVEDPGPRVTSATGSIPDYHYLWPLADQVDAIAAPLTWRLRSSDTVPPREATGAL